MNRTRLDFRRLLGFSGRAPGEAIDFRSVGLAGPVGAKVAPAICFLRGTMIGTPAGDRPVEDLVIGDLVTTLDGDARPVKWVGRQRFRRTGTTWVRDVRPVKIARGTFGATPQRDLYLSQAHALHREGALVPAGDLVGQRGVTLDAAADLRTLDYFNIELAAHGVVLAEGLPAETFLSKGGNREAFDNFFEYERLYGQEPVEPVVTAGPFVRSA